MPGVDGEPDQKAFGAQHGRPKEYFLCSGHAPPRSYQLDNDYAAKREKRAAGKDTVPATANTASASASESYLLALKRFFISHFLLPIIARSFRAKRTAAACCATHQHFGRERGLLR
jgi:hypothetical protein